MSDDGWGGKRVGAGRPVETRTLQAQKMRDRFVELCNDRADEIFDALLTVALGGYEMRKGAGKVYLKAPDVSALREICDRLWGKPVNTIDLNTEETVNLAGLAANPEVQRLTAEYEERLKEFVS